jgi:hypothetical protein
MINTSVIFCADAMQVTSKSGMISEGEAFFYRAAERLSYEQELSYKNTMEIVSAIARKVPSVCEDLSRQELSIFTSSYFGLFSWHWQELVSFYKICGDLSLIAQSMKVLPFILTHCCDDLTYSFSDSFKSLPCPFQVEQLFNLEFLKELLDKGYDQPEIIYLRSKLNIANTNFMH